jgi:hypothetical protein
MGSYSGGGGGVTNPAVIGNLTLSSGGGNTNINTTDGLMRLQQNSSSKIAIGSTDVTLPGSTGLIVGGNAQLLGGGLGFYGSTPAAKATITGSKASNAALASLLNALNVMGLVTDSTSA